MRFYPTKIHAAFLCFILISISLNLGCSKDSDLLIDSVVEDSAISTIEERTTEEVETTEEETPSVIVPEQSFESRTISFSPTNDAHIQGNKGFNQNIIRLEEGNRESFLMFDLSPIATIGGNISKTFLQFTINSDDGNGNITVYRGVSSNWTEENISETTAPETDTELGVIIKEYKIGTTEVIELDASEMRPEVATLILNHKDGNDLAFASKEHLSKIGPKLVVTYDVPVGSEEIVITTEETNEEIVDENKEPIAVADATPSSGGAPLTVAFTGSSSSDDNEVNSYSWDFKDGTLNTNANPTHTFTEIGVYEVELTVKDAEGLNSTDTVTITITEDQNEAPKALATATPKSGEAPLEVSFKGSDSTDDNSISSFNWDFKDGTLASEANPKHTFTVAGEYEVLLTVKDENGLTDKETIIITVSESENEPPIAKITTDKISGEAPLTVKFVGDTSTDDKEITSYFWDLKDDKQTRTINPTHTFSISGTYEVELTVEDKEGLSSTETVTITVNPAENEAPVAKINADKTSGEAPLTVRFAGDKSTDDKEVTSYFWDLKDSRQTRTINPSHTFSNPGTYEVELTVEDTEGLISKANLTITVTQAESENNGNYPSNAVFASSFGYNSSDATKAIKAAITSSSSFIVVDKQSGDWVVENLLFKNLQNKTIVFEEGVVLKAKSGAFNDNNRLFQLVNANNIEIRGYGATFKMNKSEYNGQQNHALALISSSNITIKGLTLRDSGGDGLYISRYTEGDYCSNIRIEDVLATNNARQGITVISVDGMIIKNSTFSNTSGEYPGAGVDFEPEAIKDRLANIVFENCVFKDNFGPGILFALQNTSGNSKPLDVTFRNTRVSNNFSTSNTTVYKTEINLGMSSTYRTNPVKGSVVFDGLTVENSKWSAISSKKTLEAYQVTIKNTNIKNVSRSSNEPAIHIGLLSYGNTSNANMGGFTFENVLIDYDGIDPSLELFGPGHGNWNLRNMRGTIKVRSPRGIRLSDNKNKLETTNSSTVTLKVIKG